VSTTTKNELTVLTELSQLIEFNIRMLKDAEAGDWEKVKASEAAREKMISSFYKNAEKHYHKDVISSATQELLSVNEKLKQLAIRAREETRSQLNDLSKGKAAIDAYNKHTR